MTSGTFKYMDTATYDPSATKAFEKAWAKVDGPGWSFGFQEHQYPVSNIRGHESDFSTDKSGFSVHHSPAKETAFTDDKAIRNGYYAEVEALLRAELPGIKKVVIFDHTIRKHDPSSPRQPVQQVHVDQTPDAAAARVRRHLPASEAEDLLQGRYQIINVWRPISHPATDFPLAVIDWRSTAPEDFVRVDLLYPDREPDIPTTTSTTTKPSPPSDSSTSSSPTPSTSASDQDSSSDDRGKELLPTPSSYQSTTNYSIKGETFGVAPSPDHKFYYVKDMTPEEAMFIKCFDSRSEWMNLSGWGGEGEGEGEEKKGVKGEQKKGVKGIAHGTPHTAFIDPETPVGAKGRESIEVRCLVFYE